MTQGELQSLLGLKRNLKVYPNLARITPFMVITNDQQSGRLSVPARAPDATAASEGVATRYY